MLLYKGINCCPRQGNNILGNILLLVMRTILKLSVVVCLFLLACKQHTRISVSSPAKAGTAEDIQTDTCGSIIPPYRGYTNDFVSLFTPEQIAVLDSICGDNEHRTTNQVTIVASDAATLGKCAIRDFAATVGNEWGVGQKGRNNGIVIAICKEIRQVAISTGTGLETKITGPESKMIIDTYMIPAFKKGNYFEGTKAGLLAVIEKTSE